jgi:hypothetical protein
MTTNGWLAKEDDDKTCGDFWLRHKPPDRLDIEAPGWAAPICWLEALPRALVGVASREIEEIEQ